MDYIQKDTCQDYLKSLEDRQYYDREPVDIIVIALWIGSLITAWTFVLKHQLERPLHIHRNL